MTQHIQLQEVILHAVVFKMGGDGLCVLGIRRVLHGGEILHIHIVRHNHQAAGMLEMCIRDSDMAHGDIYRTHSAPSSL